MLRNFEFDLYEPDISKYEEQCGLPDTPIEYFEQFLSYNDIGIGIRVPECFESEKIEELDPSAYAEKISGHSCLCKKHPEITREDITKNRGLSTVAGRWIRCMVK